MSRVWRRLRTVACNRPDGSVVTVVRAQSLSIRREPGVDDMVLGGGEQKIALFVVHDLGKRTLMSCRPGV
jgi:hypothetical protein